MCLHVLCERCSTVTVNHQYSFTKVRLRLSGSSNGQFYKRIRKLEEGNRSDKFVRKIKEYLKMSSSDDNSQKDRVHRKRNSMFCSTPVLVQKARRLSSISISAVETNSSSSAARKSRGTRGQTVEKVPTKKRKRKHRSKARRQKRRRAVIDSDSEWETKSEQSIREEAIPQRDSTQKAASTSESVLFKDVYGSPERVREAQYFFDDDRFESPVFRHIPREFGSLEKIGFKKNEGILEVEDMPTFQTCVDDVDEETDTEEELILRKRSTVITYPDTRKKKWHKIGKKIVECHMPLEKVWYPLEPANLLWDKFVKDNYEKFSKYIDRPPLSEHQKSQSSEDDECSDPHKSEISGKTVFGKLGPKKTDLSKVKVTHGWWSKSSKKWVRHEDVYNFPEPEDLEFQKKDWRGRKMTLNEYLLKCRMEKENLRHCSLDSRSSVASQNTEGSRRPSNDLGTIQNEESPCKNLEHKFERSKVESTTQSKRRTLTRSLLKIANNADIDGNGANRPVIVKNKPRIKAIESNLSSHREYIQKLLKLCEKHYAD